MHDIPNLLQPIVPHLVDQNTLTQCFCTKGLRFVRDFSVLVWTQNNFMGRLLTWFLLYLARATVNSHPTLISG